MKLTGVFYHEVPIATDAPIISLEGVPHLQSDKANMHNTNHSKCDRMFSSTHLKLNRTEFTMGIVAAWLASLACQTTVGVLTVVRKVTESEG